MNRCDREQRLTPFLLGDLAGPEAEAMRQHLAQCPVCQASLRSVEPIVNALRAGLAQDAIGNWKLETGRRAKILAVRPQSRFRIVRWASHRRPALAWAAGLMVVLGLTFSVCVVSFSGSSERHITTLGQSRGESRDLSYMRVEPPPTGAESKPAAPAPTADTPLPESASAEPARLERNLERAEWSDRDARKNNGDKAGGVAAGDVLDAKKTGPSGGHGGGGEVRGFAYAGARSGKARHAENKPMPSVPAVSGPQPFGAAPPPPPATPAPAAVNGSVTDGRAPGLSGTAAATPAPDRPLAPAPAKFDSVSVVKSPITMKGVYGSRTSGGRAAAAAGRANREKEGEEGRDMALADLSKQVAAGDEVAVTIEEPLAAAGLAATEAPGVLRSGTRRGYTAEQAQPMDKLEKRIDEIKPLRQRPDGAHAAVAEGAARALKGQTETPAGAHEELRQATDMQGGEGVTTVARQTALDAATVPPSVVNALPAAAQQPAAEIVPARKPRPQAYVFNPFVSVAAEKFSTFGIDVDTASYTLTRQALFAGQLPDAEQVRTEEIVNFFDYGDAAPDRTVFRVYVEGAPSAFNPGKTLLRIGVKGRRLGREEQRPAVLTFLIDTSGSMSQPDRIGRARTALKLLLDNLSPADRIQIVAFDDRARLILPPTSAREKKAVLAAFDRLQCNGSTNLEDGMRKAYQQAAAAFVPGAENRVILLSDGVANLGADSAQDILRQVASSRQQGITCTVFGVGSGTYNDAMLLELADKGDGMYRFLDTDEEARRVFVDDLAATLNTIARDVKIQVEWNAAAVRQYRQLGYEKRALTAQQFRDDTVDAGEVGSGQSVTALYELDLAPPTRHPTPVTGHPTLATRHLPLGTVRVRYRRTDTMAVEEIEQPIAAEIVAASLARARPQLRLAASAAGFAELLRGSPYLPGKRYEDVARLLRPVSLELSLDGRVKELLSLVEAAGALSK